MAKAKEVYVCNQCGYETAKWMGKCPNCNSWNTLEEQEVVPQPKSQKAQLNGGRVISSADIYKMNEIDTDDEIRYYTGVGELDRVLGGGIVKGSLVLLGGDPGIGKSTLLLQICEFLGQNLSILYVSGEESVRQLKLRASRLGVNSDNLYVVANTDIESVANTIMAQKPDIVMVDSIQTMYSEDIASTPGSVTQVKETAMALIHKAKNEGISVLLVGHVNKEGSIAGPKVLEHMVDAVLYFEGERQQSYRIIRAIKNRYGSTNEIGVFEMTDRGLLQVENPSEMLLSGRPEDVSGNCTLCVMEGTRPLLAEVQALVSHTVFPAPRRSSSGIDYNRMALLLAVLEKRLGLRFSASDAYLNVVGGLRIDEPAADLAVCIALISSIKDKPVGPHVVAIGEVGLAGEVRTVSYIDQRVRECMRLGFTKILLPRRSAEMLREKPKGVELVPVGSIFETLKLFV